LSTFIFVILTEHKYSGL